MMQLEDIINIVDKKIKYLESSKEKIEHKYVRLKEYLSTLLNKDGIPISLVDPYYIYVLASLKNDEEYDVDKHLEERLKIKKLLDVLPPKIKGVLISLVKLLEDSEEAQKQFNSILSKRFSYFALGKFISIYEINNVIDIAALKILVSREYKDMVKEFLEIILKCDYKKDGYSPSSMLASILELCNAVTFCQDFKQKEFKLYESKELKLRMLSSKKEMSKALKTTDRDLELGGIINIVFCPGDDVFVLDSILNDLLLVCYHNENACLQKNRKIEKNIADLEELKKQIEVAFSKEEITIFKDIVSKLEKIGADKISIQKFIHAHNCNYYKQLEEEYNHLSGKDIVKVKLLYNSFGYDYNRFSENFRKASKLTSKNIEKYLSLLSLMNVTSEPIVEYIIENAEFEDLEFIGRLVQNEIIDLKFFLNYYSLIVEKIIDIRENYAVLNSVFLWLRSCKSLNGVLLSQPDILAFNIELLEFNNILEFQNCNLSFLGDKKLCDKIALLTEFDLFENILEDANILNYPYETYLKLNLARHITNLEGMELFNFASSKLNFIDNIDEYIYNEGEAYLDDVLLMNLNHDYYSLEPIDEVCVLDSFDSGNSYIFGDIVISKSKVFINLNKLNRHLIISEDALLASIIYGSSFDNKDILYIKNCLEKEFRKSQRQL